jgi:hypothetical protein
VAYGGIDPAPYEEEAERFLRETLADHFQAQTAWPDRTDCDRLDEAFAVLEARGIICRQDFTCCGTCGHSEIGDEIAAAEEAGGTVRGYAFYHMQDTESAVDGGGLYLKYGAVAAGEATGVAVGRELAEVLTAHGLTTEWDGTLAQCVAVKLDWKRRRPLLAGFGCGVPRRPGN